MARFATCPPAAAMGFQLYASYTSVSRAYAHIVEFGEPVEVDSLQISSGDLLHRDRHGIVNIPLSIAAEIVLEAAKIRQEERELVRFCRSPAFSLPELSERIRK
jgi:4-hydroxy-4-methyl-2-oxoglutarate aldolase